MDTLNSEALIGAIAGLGVAFFLVIGLISILRIVAVWMVYEKAGEPGWAAIIPVYNAIILLKVAKMPWAWILLLIGLIIPFVNILVVIAVFVVFGVLVPINVAKNFGKDGGFAVGLIFLPVIFYCILAFGDAEYTAVEESAAVEE